MLELRATAKSFGCRAELISLKRRLNFRGVGKVAVPRGAGAASPTAVNCDGKPGALIAWKASAAGAGAAGSPEGFSHHSVRRLLRDRILWGAMMQD